MTPRFTKFVPFILEWETEYNKDGSVRTEHDPHDPGGTTRYGIDKSSHPDVDVEHLTKEAAIEIYWRHYWNGILNGRMVPVCEDLPEGVGECHMNARVNAGKGRAAKLLVESHNSPSGYIRAQDGFYHRLVVEKDDLRRYLKGWMNRLNALKTFLHV